MSETYKKLTGRVGGVGLYAQLWRASDHLLLVQSTGYSESYRRFYFRDIQEIVVEHTDRRIVFALTLIGVATILAMIAYVASSGQPVVMGLVLVPCALLLLRNQLLGRGCRVKLVTAVQSERIGALVRLPSTRRLLRLLELEIRAAQANLGPPAVPPAPPAAGAAEPTLQPDGPPPLPTFE